MKVIEIKELVKKFGRFTALDGVNLNLDGGEVLAFMGPNGAGKTTTIRALLGIIRATSGSVEMFGEDAWANAVKLHRRISFVPGDVNLWSNLTGGEVIDLFMAMRKGGKPDRKRREEYIQRFELDPSKKCRTYSKGNRQKVALVSAFASDADLFILDEPTSGLDPLMENIFHDCIREQKKDGKSVLLSSHIMSEVEKLADKIIIIREGKIVESGVMSEILEKFNGRTLEEFFLSKYNKNGGGDKNDAG
ncbi:MAG: ABC transporter ATP-binding protein [Oscillospiraceae bacterium]|nr:ABC transporter ATP-binding protein [Oscillospiraceae bacterium]